MPLILNLKGPQGTAGANGTNGTNGTNGVNGSTWYNGSGAPANTLGVDGDYYLDNNTGNVYNKVSGSWT